MSKKLISLLRNFYFLKQYKKYKKQSVVSPQHVCVCMGLVAQLCLILCDPIDCSPPGSSLSMGIFQARILEWVAISSSRGSS